MSNSRTKNKRRTKPKVSSKSKKVPVLDWGPGDRNINTLKKIEKAIFDEKNED